MKRQFSIPLQGMFHCTSRRLPEVIELLDHLDHEEFPTRYDGQVHLCGTVELAAQPAQSTHVLGAILQRCLREEKRPEVGPFLPVLPTWLRGIIRSILSTNR